MCSESCKPNLPGNNQGNFELPNSLMTCVGPAAAWEYCRYIVDENNYGYFGQKGLCWILS